ncbi:MAG: hypothetical protein KAR00_01020 [Candidatus Pacebacteria bacterium]|nr:hypothetical protein [Candidatus Paceibacterota bacterium]
MQAFFKKIIVILLQMEARAVLRKYKPKIIAVTGNVGKTSTKDAIFTVLASSFFVRKSEKSFNSEIGIPLTILGLQNGWYNPFVWLKNIFLGFSLLLFPNHYPKWLVLEVGADRPGDIKKTSLWLKPDIVVMTQIPEVPVHVEFFDTPENVIKEKGYLVAALSSNGLFIVNGDDERALSLKNRTYASSLSYGFNEENAVQASNADILYEDKKPSGVTFRVNRDGKSIPIRLRNVLGRQHIYPVLAAFSVGLSQGITMVRMGDVFEKAIFPPGRMRLIEGMSESIIIDDTYNSSPTATKEALATLQQVSVSGRKIAVLGDMLELGKYSIEEHRNAGKMASGICDLLISVGMRSRMTDVGGGAKRMGKKKREVFDTSVQAGEFLKTVVKKGDIILVKGSQSIRMEKVVEAIMAHPEQKREFLVRQEDEWAKK